MLIKPIEVVSMAPKSQVITPIKQQDAQKPLIEQAQITQQFNKDIRHNSQQTIKTIKSENNEYRYDAKDKGNGTYNQQGKKQKKSNKDKEQMSKPNNRAGSIDIRI